MTGTAESGPSSPEGRARWGQVANGWLLGCLGEVAGSQMRSGGRWQPPGVRHTAGRLKGPDRGEKPLVSHTSHGIRRKYLVGGHRERENVALL